MSGKEYFAGVPTDEIASELMGKIKAYYQFIQTSGKLYLWRRSYQTYYGPAMRGSQVNSGGEAGELTLIQVNQYRNLLKHLHTLTTSQRPAYEPRATNTDEESQAQCILASGLLDYYLREKQLERYLKQSVEFALVLGEGFISCIWNATSGEQYGTNPDTGAVIYQGDIQYRAFGPMDYIRDFSKDTSMNHEWGVTREWTNKFNLAAKYPEFADQIVALTWDNEDLYNWKESNNDLYLDYTSDDIPLYTFYHKQTDAMPKGRMTQILSDDIVLFDGPIPYREVPVYRISCSEWLGSIFGYTSGYDLMPLQEMSDALHSTITTNQNAFGVQNIWLAKGHNIDVTTLAGGLKVIETAGIQFKPEPLQLTNTPKECFDYLGILEKAMETLSGVNSVSRGNPEASLKSGAALALVQSMSIQFSQDLQQSYAQELEDVGTATLILLRDFAAVPRVAAITGKANRRYMRDFSGKDLSQINRVTVDVGNPLTRTTAGKVNIAEQLMANGMVSTPEQYIQVLTTGKLEPIYENEQAMMMLIRGENEKMQDGEPQPVVMTDNHPIHVKEHEVVLSSPESRANPNVVMAVTQHIQQHITLWKTMDPALAGFLKMPIPPPMMPIDPATGQPIAPPPQAPPPGGAPNVDQEVNATNPTTQKAQNVKQPGMPRPPKGADQQSAQVINHMAAA